MGFWFFYMDVDFLTVEVFNSLCLESAKHGNFIVFFHQ